MLVLHALSRLSRERGGKLTLLVEDDDVAAGKVDGMRSAEAGNC